MFNFIKKLFKKKAPVPVVVKPPESPPVVEEDVKPRPSVRIEKSTLPRVRCPFKQKAEHCPMDFRCAAFSKIYKQGYVFYHCDAGNFDLMIRQEDEEN